MLKLLGARLIRLIATLFAVSLLTFLLGSLLPGDPVNAILPPDAPRDQATVERIRADLGLDDPLPVRYLNWLGDAVRGDLGYSYITDQPVWATIKQRLPVTFELALLATLIALAVAVPLGIIGGYREGRPVDKLSSVAVQIGLSVPSFIVAVLLSWLFTVRTPEPGGPNAWLTWVLFSLVGAAALWAVTRPGFEDQGRLLATVVLAAGILLTFSAIFGWFGSTRVGLYLALLGFVLQWAPKPIADQTEFIRAALSWVALLTVAHLLVKLFTMDTGLPSTGWNRISETGLRENLRTAILPAVALCLSPMAIYTRLLRSDMIGTLKEDFVLSARAKGLTDRYVLGRHALRPSSLSLVTIIGIQVGILLGGTVVIEQIFALPGLGFRLLNAIYQRDITMVQGITVFIAATYVILNTIVDFVYMAIDPRIRRR